MKASAPAGLLTMIVCVFAMPAAGLERTLQGTSALAEEMQPVVPPAEPVPHSAVPDRDTIRAAVRQIVAERVAEQPAMPRLHAADTLRANQYDVFARKVEEATVPDCLHAEGLKRQPTFFITGFYALPFIAVAKLRGVCQ